MIVAIASGKGGTGKTTVAVNLARVLGDQVELLDCDVEAPNDHLFLHPRIERSEPAGVPVPRVDHDRCTLCGECADICQYNAIAVLRTGVMVFPELCHGCGGCSRFCPERAIEEVVRPIGMIEQGTSGSIRTIHGRLNVGETLAPPLIRSVRARAHGTGTVLIDAPPGASCPMLAAVSGCDLALLVTESTPFGLNDFRLAVGAVRELGVPSVAVVNRVGTGDDRVRRFCSQEGIEIIAEIPEDRRIAEIHARGGVLVDELPDIRALFDDMATRLLERAAAVVAPRANEGG